MTAYYGNRQAELVTEQNEINRASLTAVQRAFVNVTDAVLKPVRDPKTGKVAWWTVELFAENSGATPTRNLRYRTFWLSKQPGADEAGPARKRVLDLDTRPSPFREANLQLGPKAKAQIGYLFISRAEELEMLAKQENQLLFGTMTYQDRLTPSEWRRTDFCVVIAPPAPLRDTKTGEAGQITFDTALDTMEMHANPCPANNCADEECSK